MALGGAKPRAVLAVLLLHANEPVSADRLALALWGEDAPASAVKTVQVHVSRLRKALGDRDVLTSTGAAYTPARAARASSTRTASSGSWPRAARRWRPATPEQAAATAARARWRCGAGRRWTSSPTSRSRRPRSSGWRSSGWRRSRRGVEADLAAGRHAELVGELQRLTSRHPCRERLQRDLMLALYRCGRQAEALARLPRRAAAVRRRARASSRARSSAGSRRRCSSTTRRSSRPRAAAPPAAAPPPEPAAPVAPARRAWCVAELVRSPAAQLDPESLHAVLDACAQALERHGGAVEKSIGDAVVGVFGLTETHEDDALRAVRAAVELRDDRWADLATASTGSPSTRARSSSAPARAASRSPRATRSTSRARLQEAAAAGEILLGELTCRLAEQARRGGAAGRSAGLPPGGCSGWSRARTPRRRCSATPFVGRERGARRAALRAGRARRPRAALPARDGASARRASASRASRAS